MTRFFDQLCSRRFRSMNVSSSRRFDLLVQLFAGQEPGAQVVPVTGAYRSTGGISCSLRRLPAQPVAPIHGPDGRPRNARP